METRGHVVVIGSTNTDMVAKVPHIPAPGETVMGESFSVVPGGKGANQALAAARMGARVTFVGCVGEDSFAPSALANLRRAGVDLSYCAQTGQTHSGIALIAVDQAGQNAIVVAPGANMHLTPEHVDRARPAIAAAQVLVLQCEIPIETVTYAARLGRELGKVVVLNPAPARPLPQSLLQDVDVLTPNESEARILLGILPGNPLNAFDAALRLLDTGVQLVVITLGRKGALAAGRLQGRVVVKEVPAFEVVAMDATAAGDCFTGALAAILAERALAGDLTLEPTALREPLRLASAAAALSVTRMGAQPSLPTRDELNGWLAQMPGASSPAEGDGS